MTQKKNESNQDLRRRAEITIEALADHSDMAKALHELKVHQIEMEMQNEELRSIRDELETSRARYFDLYNLAPVGYCTIDQQGLIVEANLTAAAQLGVAREVLARQSITRFIFLPDREVYARNGQQLFATGTPQVCELRMKPVAADPFWVRLEGNLAHEGDGSLLCRLVISDISARKKVEEALERSEEKYRTVANFTHDWEFWLGPEGNFLYCSPSCQEITGHPATAFEKDPSLLRALIHPEDLAVYDQHRHPDKERKSPQEIEFRIKHAAGSKEWRWISHRCHSVFGDQGQFLGIRGSNHDVTEHKRLEAEVVKSQNLKSLGVLAGGIAHDFNNLLQSLFGNIELAKMYTEESSKAYPFLENASQVFHFATKLTAQLIAFSGGGFSTPINIEPAKHIKAEVAAALAGSGLVAEFALASDLWPVHVEPDQFRQVIKQLVLNAKEAMSPGSGGSIRVMAVNEPLVEPSQRHLPLTPGNYVRVSIEDQGCGISQEDLTRIFDPYFSTKQRGFEKGMGLGLALCDAIIRKQGGAITVQSKPGHGTTVHIHIPAAEAAINKTTTIKDLGTKGIRLLLMEDDPIVVEVTTIALRISGYRVDSTLDGDAAIAAYQEARAVGDPYAVVILDLLIPGGMGGKEVIAKLKEIDSEVKAIVCSGYTNDDVMTDFAAYGFVAACPKPYQISEMAAIIKQLV